MSEYIELKPVMDFIDINIALAKKQVEENKTSTDFWQGYYTAKEEIYRAMKAFLETEPKSDVDLVKHGKWKYYHKQNKAVCTNCSFERDLDADFGRAIVCPNCGARMDGGGRT